MKPRVVLFGSGSVALESFKALQKTFEFEAIITKPATEYEMHAAFPKIPILPVSNRNELDKLLSRKHLTSTAALLIDFGIIVSKQAIDSFPDGIINSHFSLLPEWRGADPITFAILSGQATTGVSLMLLDPGLDEGPLLAQVSHPIAPTATISDLTAQLIEVSTALLEDIVPKYLGGFIQPTPQDPGNKIMPTYSRKLVKENGRVDWHKPANVIEREIRAFLLWPHSYTSLAGLDIIITSAQVVNLNGKPGQVHIENDHLYVYCGEQALEILDLKPSGKKNMNSRSFLAGYRRLF